jgi:phosphotriesterase-related protein
MGTEGQIWTHQAHTQSGREYLDSREQDGREDAAMRKPEGVVRTVLGDVPSDSLGMTLAHEHIFIDLRNQFRVPADENKRTQSAQLIDESTINLLARNPYALVDNLLLDDLDTAAAELDMFKSLGGSSVVDCTSRTLGRAPVKLRELSKRTGLHIVAGCGYYTQDTHPADMADRPVESIAEELVGDLTDGIEGSGIRAGVIGEIGTGAELHPDERKNLLAAAMAHQEVPAAIHVHTFPWARAALEIADLLIGAAVEPAKVVIDHLDVDIDVGYIERLLARGVMVEFDCFGKEYQLDASDEAFAPGPFALDTDRVDVLTQLIDKGYTDQLLIANDICFKTLLVAYGGNGYAHVIKDVVPLLRDRGVDSDTIDALLVQNPMRLYTI